MYTYETFYDHYVIKKDGNILYHIDTEKEAKEEIALLENKQGKTNKQQVTKDKNYTCYHLHTEQSLLDSCTNYKLYIDKAKELNQTSIAFTEHGNLYSWVEKKMYCEEQGIKYIHGVECYLTETLDEKIRDNYHTVLLSKNRAGFVELNNLVLLSTTKDHKYYKPRLSFDEFLGISDNIIKISACLASPLRQYKGDKLDSLLRHYDYYEIQYHNVADQIEYNQWLYDMSKKYNKPLLVGTDTHSITSYKAECRTILQWGKTDGAWGDSENEFDLVYKSYDKLVECFKVQNSLPMDVILQAIENTNIMADSCEEIILDKSIKYPILYGEKDEEVLWNTLRSKYKYKAENGIIDNTKIQEYGDKIKEEMRVFKKTNMVGFMLFMSEMMTWCRENNIPTSPCRGCFTDKALIHTKNNMKTINNVKIGDYILSADGKWNKVLNTFKYNIKEPLIEFEYLKQGSSYKSFQNQCTLDHKVLVNRNNKVQYVKAEDLKIGDLLCSPKIKHKHQQEDKENIIDLNKYNVFNFEYDNNYIYEKTPTNIPYKYSPRWCEKNIGVSSAFCKRIMGGYIPTSKNGVKVLQRLLNNTPFKTIENYKKYLQKHAFNIVKIPRYIKHNYLWNVFIGMMYGDGWTQQSYAIGLAVNNTSKNIYNRKVFYDTANILGVNIYVNSSKNKNLEQLFINSKIINNYFKNEYFSSKKDNDKIFNSNLFDQSFNNLKGLYNGLLKTDGSVSIKDNKLSFDNTSLSLVSAFKTLSNIVDRNMPLSLDVRFAHKDKRGFNNKQSYKIRKSIRMSKLIIKQDEDFWYLPITKISKLQEKNTNVYDLEIENNHSYTINNIVVHNSVGGSEVAYISDIIDVDPVRWHTVFSRFCNESRLEVGDIDCDFYEEDRPKVYDYIINRFGTEKTAYILASGTVVDKGTIDLIGRALHNKWKDANGIGKNDKSQDHLSPYNLKIVTQIKQEYEDNPNTAKEKYKELFYYFDGIVNTVVSQSQHPAGIVASPINLIDNYSMFIGENGQYILPINMEEVHEIGLVKYDILGLKQVGIIKKTCEYANIKYPSAHELDWNDQNVYKDMCDNSIGVFQFEGNFAHELLKTFGVKSIDDMSLVNASLRPSGESYRDKLMQHIPNKNPSKIIDDMLKSSFGYLVFQEQTIQFLQELCGLSGSEADNVRRAIGRKQIDRLQKALPQILDGYCSVSDKPRDMAEQEAKQFIQIIEDSSSYQFGFNHSTGYSMLGYLCAYMRYYYPKEFVCAYLNCAETDEDKQKGITLAKQKGIAIYPPKFRKSLSNFMIDPNDNAIYKGISSIKSIGKQVGSDLYSLKDNTYPTFFDLLIDLKTTSINKTALNILTKLDFFSEFGDINTLLYQTEIYNKFATSKIITKSKLSQYELDCIQGCYNKETKSQYRELDNIKFMQNLINNANLQKATDYEKVGYELKYLGYSNIILPNEPNNICGVANVDIDQWNRPWVTLYRLCDGYSDTVKVDKKWFNDNKCGQGDILRCAWRDRAKMRKVGEDNDGKNLFEYTGEFEDVLKVYSVLN